MENNDSPYVYEKPLSSARPKRALAIAAVSLTGIGSIIGGTAFASAVVSSVSARENVMPISSASGTSFATIDEETGKAKRDGNQISAAAIATSIPLLTVEPTKSSPQVQLPAISTTDWGNLSSATPSSGSGNASGGQASYSEDQDHDDDDDYERHDRDDKHDNDDHEGEDDD